MMSDNRPCFYKFFLSHQTMIQEQIKIPTEFVEDILKSSVTSASEAYLKGPSGGSWSVKIVKTEKGDVFLEKGWLRFVRENLIHENDFLVFQYDGDMSFSVQIFHQSGLEKLASECQQPEGKRAGVAVKEEAKSFSFSSKLPFFETHIKDYNLRGSTILNIPKSFTDKYFLKKQRKVILRSWGKAWEMNCRVYKRSFSLGVGWKSFANDNKLKVGDVCIFELVDEMELQVHIFNNK